jgi:polyhydroxyalkanoate synthesis regulator phasin
MPPAKRAPSATSKSSPPARRPAAKKTTPAAKATATTARKSTAKTATTAKSGATKTTNAAKSGAAATASAAKTAVKSTATTAKAGAKETTTRAKAASTQAQNSKDTVTLSRAHLQEVFDDAAARGRITRKDANDLVADLMRRGKSTGEEVSELLGKGRARLRTATKKVSKAEPVDRLVRGADRARRAAGVGPSFPIIGYDELNVSQVQARITDLSKPDKRKVLTYERKHANRKSVVGALEKQLA